MATLKLYVDRNSQPSRAVLLFCKVNRIEFEEVTIDLFKGEHHTPEFEEVNPLKLVPAITHGDFKLSESNAILIYIASAFPGAIADHWYPADLQKRATLHSLLDWHHTNLRRGAMGYVLHVLAPVLNLKTQDNPLRKAEGESTLLASFATIETVWLQGSGKFLLGSDRPTIADLALVCEITELQLLEGNDYARLLGPYKKVQQWIEDIKEATNPHFEEVHQRLYETIACGKSADGSAK